MTRPTLLHLLAHPTTLTGADVRELEQLAQAFPYCQTAHLLLAKAAHDQGSMLAGQRLRRAATYAADRALLRQLIETVPAVAEPVLAETPALVATEAAPMATELLPSLPPAEAVIVAEPEPEPILLEVEHAVLPLLPAPVSDDDSAEVADLPAQAPPIRPPAEAATARHEFGLAQPEPAELVAYQLPDLPEPAPDLVDAPALARPTAAELPLFLGVADVGYAPGEGSRLGFCLQSAATEFTAFSLAGGPAGLLPAALLPPAGEFFAPDASVLAHLAAHRTPAAAEPAAKELIANFLRRAPQAASRRRALPPPDAVAEDQPDLADYSTRVVPDLASESLAKILTQQGKPDRAIAIYERLMVKHPEKMAYFAAQIDSLRPSA